MAEEKITLSPETVVEQLRAIRDQMPASAPLSPENALRLRRTANVSANFMASTINTVGASPDVQAALRRQPETLRQELAGIARWTAVEDELRAMLKSVSAANLIRRHRLGLTALQTYSICRQLTRDPEHAGLLPFLQEMKRLNRMGRRRRTVPAQPEPEAPATPPVTTGSQ